MNRSIPRIIVGNSLGRRCVPKLFSSKDTNPFGGGKGSQDFIIRYLNCQGLKFRQKL